MAILYARVKRTEIDKTVFLMVVSSADARCRYSQAAFSVAWLRTYDVVAISGHRIGDVCSSVGQRGEQSGLGTVLIVAIWGCLL